MTAPEWESLCDGCGRCCLVKLEDEDTERVVYTDLACHMFDGESCRCRDYPNRQREVPDCLQLTPESVSRARLAATILRLSPAFGRPSPPRLASADHG